MSDNKFEKSKMSYIVESGTMYMQYEGLGKEKIPDSLMEELRNEAINGNPKVESYYYSEEFIDRCIEHSKRN